jgi:hypothetical protein
MERTIPCSLTSARVLARSARDAALVRETAVASRLRQRAVASSRAGCSIALAEQDDRIRPFALSVCRISPSGVAIRAPRKDGRDLSVPNVAHLAM